jgi:hypothetical protein
VSFVRRKEEVKIEQKSKKKKVNMERDEGKSEEKEASLS